MFKALFDNTAAPVSRLPWIDYAKGIAIVLVVYRHIMIGLQRASLDVPQYYVNINESVFSFRMPLFFLLAGFFIQKSIGKRSSGEFVFTKFDTILYPYLLWAGVQVTIQIALSQFTNSSRTWMDYVYILVHPRAIDQFWFLYAMFNTTVLYLLFYRLFKGNSWTIFLISIGMHFASTFFEQYDLLRDLLYYFMFIAIGDLTSKFMLDEKNKKLLSSYWLALILLPLFVVCQWVWFAYLSDGRNMIDVLLPDLSSSVPAIARLNVFVIALVALAGCSFMVNISFILERLGLIKSLRYVGFYSLYIYLMHVIVSAGARTALIHIFKITNTHVLLISGIILGVLIPIIIYNLAMRFGWWFLFHCRKPKTLQTSQA